MSRVIGCVLCECDIAGMHHDDDCPNHPDNLGRPDAPPPEVKHCQAGQDGDCDWKDCPQTRDGEPGRTGRHCPLDICTKCHEMRQLCECDEFEPTVIAPPSDAAPVLQNDVLNYLWGQATLGDEYAEGLANRMEAVPDAHPRPDNEDAQPVGTRIRAKLEVLRVEGWWPTVMVVGAKDLWLCKLFSSTGDQEAWGQDEDLLAAILQAEANAKAGNWATEHPEDAPGGPWIDFDDLNAHHVVLTVGATIGVLSGLFAGQRGTIIEVDYGTQKARFELDLNRLKGEEGK